MDEAARFVKQVIASLLTTRPLAYAALAPMDVIVVDGGLPGPAATDGMRLFVDRRWVEKVMERGGAEHLVAVLLHEALHALFAHPARVRGSAARFCASPLALNVAADAKVNAYLVDEMGVRREALGDVIWPSDAARMLNLSVHEIVNLPIEAIAARIGGCRGGKAGAPTRQQQGQGGSKEGGGAGSQRGEKQGQGQGSGSSQAKGEGRGGGQRDPQGGPGTGSQHRGAGEGEGGGAAGDLLTVEEGDRLAGRGVRAWEGMLSRDPEARRRLREALERGDAAEAARELARAVEQVVRAAEAARAGGGLAGVGKLAGRGRGGFEALLEELARGVVDWRELVVETLYDAFRPDRIRRTWSRFSKKLGPARPGTVTVGGIDRIVAAIDVSGSISDDEYALMASAVLDAAAKLRPRRATIIWWDDGVQRVEEAPARLTALRERLRRRPGYGGTAIREAIEEAARRARRGRDTVVILASDWYLSEEPGELRELMRMLRRTGARVAVIATPDHDPLRFSVAREHADLAIVLPERDPFKRTGA